MGSKLKLKIWRPVEALVQIESLDLIFVAFKHCGNLIFSNYIGAKCLRRAMVAVVNEG